MIILASCLANSAPMTSPKPQLIQLAISDTKVTSMMALPGVLASEAMLARPFFTGGVLASMKPEINTSSICIEKVSRFQKPSPQ